MVETGLLIATKALDRSSAVLDSAERGLLVWFAVQVCTLVVVA
jgi:hypothetical protein